MNVRFSAPAAVSIAALLLAAPTLAAGQALDQQDIAIIQKYRAAAPDVESGKAFLLKGKYEEAEKKLQRALETLPEHAIAAYFLADCYYRMGRLDEGLAAIQKAEANFGDFNRVLYRWQMTQVDQIAADKIRQNDLLADLQNRLSQAKTDSERSQIQNEISRAQASQNSSAQQTKEQLAYESYATPGDYYYVHGNLLFKKKDYPAALGQYLKAVEVDPKHGNAYNNIANLYYMRREYDKAREYLEKAEANGAKINPAFKQAIAEALNK